MRRYALPLASALLAFGFAACSSSSRAPVDPGPDAGDATIDDAPDTAPDSVAETAAEAGDAATDADAGWDGAIDGGPTNGGATPSFTFESGPVRPLAMSPDGTRLFVANTANGSLDVFTIDAGGLTPAGSVFVGIDPVAVAARTNGEVWVVNHVSDSVSIVDVSSSPPRVVRTLLVGDEPRDVVFAGPGRNRAFITTAHRGQQRVDPSIAAVPGAGDPQLTTPGVGRADVWVFDADALGTTVGGTPTSIVTLFGDTPRGLAVTPDGATVYVGIFHSGNQTTATNAALACAGFDSPTKSSPCTVDGTALPGAPPGPATNHEGLGAPAVGLVLRADGAGAFRDLLGRDWSAAVRFSLPDQDVFALDASTLATKSIYTHVGTTLFNLAVNPSSGAVYVSNHEARNDLRFEGPGTYAGSALTGHLAEARITVLKGTSVTPRRLNTHVDYAVQPAPVGASDKSLSTPLELAISGDGKTIYVAAFGSSKIGVIDAAALEGGTFDATSASAKYVSVTGGGPSAVLLDEARKRLYVATRFDDGLSVIDLTSGAEASHRTLENPEPSGVAQGRPLLYDARATSSNGEASCASCHTFGDADHLGWDLGNPDGDVITTPVPIHLRDAAPASINGGNGVAKLHPMKGPMVTQTLRGMVNHGAMHWRGDRAVGVYGTDTTTTPPFNATLSFMNFAVAFDGLLGARTRPGSLEMAKLTDFALKIVMPPNPVRALDDSLTPAQARGKQFFMGCAGLDSSTKKAVQCVDGRPAATAYGHLSDGIAQPGLGFTCEGCHKLDPAQGFFGTDGRMSFESLPQTAKIPQLRNLYDKVGMFGVASHPGTNAGDNGAKGAQIRGFGFQHDGSVDTLFRFFQATVFNSASGGAIGFDQGDSQRRDVEQYMLAFDSDLPPIVGQQVTLRSDDATAVGPRIDLFIARATTPYASKLLGPGATECTLVARVVVAGVAKTYRMQPDRTFVDASGAKLTDAALRALATTPGQEVTYTCMPYGW
jgi:DNA-binding beta-propeller fold protein YncE